MPSSYEDRLRKQEASRNADQTEYEAILNSSVVVEAGIRDDTISGAIDDLEVAATGDGEILGSELWATEDIRLDSSAGNIREEIERRITLLGDNYPFVLDRGQLIHRKSESGFYEFCLAICRAPNITAGEYVNLPRGFERYSATLVQHYMGADSECQHIGWPRTLSRFREAMAPLEVPPYEWTWDPETGLPENPTPRTVKDESVDFIVTKRLFDKRAGRLYLLAQCACGDDWPSKFNELSIPKLGRWFRTTSLVPPVRAFATPFLLADEMLREATREAGIVFDRARLTMIAEKCLPADEKKPFFESIEPLTRMIFY